MSHTGERKPGEKPMDTMYELREPLKDSTSRVSGEITARLKTGASGARLGRRKRLPHIVFIPLGGLHRSRARMRETGAK